MENQNIKNKNIKINKTRPVEHSVHGFSRVQNVIKMPVVLMLIVSWIFFSVMCPSFLTESNITTLIVVNAFVFIAAAAQVFVLLTGGIDLSVAHVLTCSSICSAISMVNFQTAALNTMLNTGSVFTLKELMAMFDKTIVNDMLASVAPQAILIGLLVAVVVGLAFGIFNGIAVGYFKMVPFIVTLVTQLIARGLSYAFSQGISIQGTPKILTELSYKFGIPFSKNYVFPWVAVIMIALLVVCGLLLAKSRWGRMILLTGSNSESARFVGINVKIIKASVYAFSGLLVGIGGFIAIMCLGTADPKVGDSMLLTVIGSVILGGISMAGGEGNMTKAVLGMILFATLISGMTNMNLNLPIQQIVQGIVLIVGLAIGARISLRKE